MTPPVTPTPSSTDNTPDGSFDTIDYEKGGSIIRMMQGMLGEEVFIAGVRQYLRHFQYSNAYSTDLFSELTAAASSANLAINVTSIMYEWTAVGRQHASHTTSQTHTYFNTHTHCS